MTDQAPAGDENRKQEEMRDAVELAAETLGKDLLTALINELQVAKAAWGQLSELDQNASIERLRQRVHKLVGEALGIMLLQQYPVVAATVVGVRFKKGITVALSLDKRAEGRHDLADAEGKSVLVVIADPDELREGMASIRAAAKQGELFTGDAGVAFGENYTGGDERPFRRDEPGVGEEPAPALELAVDLDQPHEYRQDPNVSWLCCCGKKAEDEIHIAPQAPADLEVERDPLWKQAVVGLASIGIEVFENIAEGWTEEQCTEAAYFVTLARDNADKPDQIPVPQFITDARVDVAAGGKAGKRRRRREPPADGAAAGPAAE